MGELNKESVGWNETKALTAARFFPSGPRKLLEDLILVTRPDGGLVSTAREVAEFFQCTKLTIKRNRKLLLADGILKRPDARIPTLYMWDLERINVLAALVLANQESRRIAMAERNPDGLPDSNLCSHAQPGVEILEVVVAAYVAVHFGEGDYRIEGTPPIPRLSRDPAKRAEGEALIIGCFQRFAKDWPDVPLPVAAVRYMRKFHDKTGLEYAKLAAVSHAFSFFPNALEKGGVDRAVRKAFERERKADAAAASSPSSEVATAGPSSLAEGFASLARASGGGGR